MIKVITPPTSEPVAIADFKAWMRGVPVPPDQTTMINMLLAAGREEAEKYQNAAYMEQTLQIALDAVPPGAIVLPRPPFKELVSVMFYGMDGSETDMTSKIAVNDIAYPAEICMMDAQTWPVITPRNQNPVVITYKAGSDTVSERVKQAILLYATWSYMHPGGEEPIPDAFYSLLQKGRVRPV